MRQGNKKFIRRASHGSEDTCALARRERICRHKSASGQTTERARKRDRTFQYATNSISMRGSNFDPEQEATGSQLDWHSPPPDPIDAVPVSVNEAGWH